MYVYRHQNGTYHFKVDFAVDFIGAKDYFDSPFVSEWKYFDSMEEAKKWVEKNKLRDGYCPIELEDDDL